MSGRNGAAKVGSVIIALAIGIGIVGLAGSLMLPSTKRARVDWDEVRRLAAEDEAAAAAATAPTTAAVAATAPTTARPRNKSVAKTIAGGPDDDRLAHPRRRRELPRAVRDVPPARARVPRQARPAVLP